MNLNQFEEFLVKTVHSTIKEIKDRVGSQFLDQDRVKKNFEYVSSIIDLNLQKLKIATVFASDSQIEETYQKERQNHQQDIQKLTAALPKEVSKMINTRSPLLFFDNVELENLNESSLQQKKYENCVGFFQLQDGKRNGRGLEFYNSGAFFEGYFLDDKATGKGLYVSSSGLVHEGNNLNNTYHGYGEWPLEESYCGDHINNQASGFGKKTYKNGEVYLGFWKENKKFGYGEIIDKSGKIISRGIYKDDQMIKKY